MDPQIVQRMIMAIAVLLLLDAVMTWYVVSKPGYSEANFIVKRLIEKIGMVPAMVAKTIIGFGLLGVLWFGLDVWPGLTSGVVIALFIIAMLVDLWNLHLVVEIWQG